MTNQSLNEAVREIALKNGADLVGAVKVSDLPEHLDSIATMLPSARSVVVTAAKHSLAAIRSKVNQLAQFDTIHAYDECGRAAHKVSRLLESNGFPSAAVPAFIPIDMDEPGRGMRGEICWRRAGVRAGLGSYGENGLLITRQFGSAIRLSGLVTSAELDSDLPLRDDVCDHCMRCVEACPVHALSGGRKINKKSCGETIFKFGFRFFQRFMQGILDGATEEPGRIVKGYELRELWQTFVTGNYYYCFECQAQCPALEMPEMR
ncbi:MAG: 4Fe-4S binding protein [Desulfomonilaceae bacterium]|nr:4Fe-4S binding protein [Desulfomonilaceae bacterium]